MVKPEGDWDPRDYDPFRQSNFSTYKNMAYRFYTEYTSYQQEYDSMVDDVNGNFDLNKHSAKDQLRYLELIEEKESCCVAAIVFEAFACEAYINWICEKYVGSEMLRNLEYNKVVEVKEYKTSKIDRKIRYLTEYIFRSDSSIDCGVLAKLALLMSTRNRLAHNKTTNVSFDMDEEDFLVAVWNMGVKGESIYSIVEQVVGTCQLLQTEMKRMMGNAESI